MMANSNGASDSTDVAPAELTARLRALEVSFEGLLTAVSALVDPETGMPAPAPAEAQPGAEGSGEPLYPDLEAWVTGWFAPIFGRRLDAGGWCAQWWLHAEAIVRLEALWRSWETLRLDPGTGMAVWLVNYLDPQRGVLIGDNGPLSACTATEHHPPPPLSVQPALPGTWPPRELPTAPTTTGGKS